MRRALLPILASAVASVLVASIDAHSVPATGSKGGARPSWSTEPRDIQAICHIDMKRGPDIEGVIILGRIYPYFGTSYWDANGFYFTNENGSSSAILFDKYWDYIKNGEIAEFDPVYKGVPYRSRPKRKDVIAWPERDHIYFLSSRAMDEYDPENTVASISASIDSSSRPLIYRTAFVERFSVEYELLDYIPVYPRIPDEVAVRGATSIKPIHIMLRDIKKFRILLRPSERWAYDIDAARKRGERNHVFVAWFDKSSLPGCGPSSLYSPWENRAPPDSSRTRTDLHYKVEPFDLQAICHIETPDSQIVEGAILIASDVRPNDGYENIPQTNGFFFVEDRRYPPSRSEDRWRLLHEACLMPLDFDVWHYSHVPDRVINSSPLQSSWCNSSPDKKDYYLRDVTVEKYGKGRFREVKSEVVHDGSALVLKRSVENRYPGAFEMLECIPVFPEVPRERSLRKVTSIEPVCVPVSSIREFRILQFPSVLWLTRIALAEQEARNAGDHREDVRWLLKNDIQGGSLNWIKSNRLYKVPRHPGLDLSNIRGY
jgi:hypothetical protein